MAKRNKQAKRDARRSSVFRGRTPAEDADHRAQRREGLARQQAMRSGRYDDDDDFVPSDPHQNSGRVPRKSKGRNKAQSQGPSFPTAAQPHPSRYSPPKYSYRSWVNGGSGYDRPINGARVDAIAEEMFGTRYITAKSLKSASPDTVDE